MKNNLQLTCK